MTFLQRFKYYGFGVILGCLIAYMLLIRGRGCYAWTPNDRVINQLAVDSVVIDESVQLPFPDSLLIEHIKASEVVFDESLVRDVACKEYQLESDAERMRFKVCKREIRLIDYRPQ